MMQFARTAALVAAAVALYGVSLPASTPARADDNAEITIAANFSDARLTAFVAAAKEVFAVREKYRPQFEAASTDDEKKKVVLAARGEMKKAIEGHGLTIEQYNAVLTAARSDRTLASRLEKLLSVESRPKGS
jgi:hypothetical protein